MPLQLTTPIDCGDLDTDYTHVKVSQFLVSIKNSEVSFHIMVGYMSGDDFVEGKFKASQIEDKKDHFVIRNIPAYGEDPADPQYDNFIGGAYGHDGVLLYDDVASEIYQWLIDNNEYAGAIV